MPVKEGSEEYLNSEKYEIRERALDGPLLPMMRRLNEIRHENVALQHLSNVAWLDDGQRPALRLRQAGARQHDHRRRPTSTRTTRRQAC